MDERTAVPLELSIAVTITGHNPPSYIRQGYAYKWIYRDWKDKPLSINATISSSNMLNFKLNHVLTKPGFIYPLPWCRYPNESGCMSLCLYGYVLGRCAPYWIPISGGFIAQWNGRRDVSPSPYRLRQWKLLPHATRHSPAARHSALETRQHSPHPMRIYGSNIRET